jgi:hypothetical protein
MVTLRSKKRIEWTDDDRGRAAERPLKRRRRSIRGRTDDSVLEQVKQTLYSKTAQISCLTYGYERTFWYPQNKFCQKCVHWEDAVLTNTLGNMQRESARNKCELPHTNYIYPTILKDNVVFLQEHENQRNDAKGGGDNNNNDDRSDDDVVEDDEGPAASEDDLGSAASDDDDDPAASEDEENDGGDGGSTSEDDLGSTASENDDADWDAKDNDIRRLRQTIARQKKQITYLKKSSRLWKQKLYRTRTYSVGRNGSSVRLAQLFALS